MAPNKWCHAIQHMADCFRLPQVRPFFANPPTPWARSTNSLFTLLPTTVVPELSVTTSATVMDVVLPNPFVLLSSYTMAPSVVVAAALPTLTVTSTIIDVSSASPDVPLSSSTIASDAVAIAALPTPSATSTMTMSTTTVVSSSVPEDTAQEISPSDSTNVPQNAAPSTTPETMSFAAQLGMGFGITFGLLCVVGLVGIYIWHRRRRLSKESDGDLHQENYRERLAGLLTFKKRKDNQDDAEWTIESAEQMPIIRNVRPQSVSMLSRPDSGGSSPYDTDGATTSTIPKCTMSLALSSHPLTPKYTAFPVGSHEAQAESVKKDESKDGARNSTKWPL